MECEDLLYNDRFSILLKDAPDYEATIVGADVNIYAIHDANRETDRKVLIESTESTVWRSY